MEKESESQATRREDARGMSDEPGRKRLGIVLPSHYDVVREELEKEEEEAQKPRAIEPRSLRDKKNGARQG